MAIRAHGAGAGFSALPWHIVRSIRCRSGRRAIGSRMGNSDTYFLRWDVQKHKPLPDTGLEDTVALGPWVRTASRAKRRNTMLRRSDRTVDHLVIASPTQLESYCFQNAAEVC